MTVSNTPSLHPIVVEISWTDEEGTAFNLACSFRFKNVRHAVTGHVGNASESWGRLLPGSVAGRLATAARGGQLPTAEDFGAFVEGVGKAMQTSGQRPLLCRYAEKTLGVMRGDQRKSFRGSTPITKVMLVLQSGGVAFVEIDGGEGQSLTGNFLTCYFPRPRQPGWTSGKRAYAVSVEHFVMKWAPHMHRCGAQKIPSSNERVKCSSEGREVERSRFTFVTPESWGFRPADDGVLVFREAPAWQ